MTCRDYGRGRSRGEMRRWLHRLSIAAGEQDANRRSGNSAPCLKHG